MARPRTSIRQKLALVAFGLLLSVLLLEAALRAGGALFLWAQEGRNRLSLERGGTYRILCLGESTTALGGEHAYPRLLEEELNRRADGITFSVINRGVPAITTDQILRAVPGHLERYQPDLVIAMMGVNDGSTARVAYEDGPWHRLLEGLASLRSVKLLQLLAERLAPAPAPAPEGGALLKGLPGLREFAELRAWLGRVTEQELVADLERDPDRLEAHHRLAAYYAFEEKRFTRAKEILEALVEAGRADAETFHLLRLCYGGLAQQALQEDRPERVLELLGEAESKGHLQEDGLTRLSLAYQQLGDDANAERFAQRARALRLRTYNPKTRANYLRLKRLLDERGIRLVVSGYPMRSVEPVRKLLGWPDDVVFVDNELVFRRELGGARYSDLFIDSFAGDFGHMTERGHRLLAENVAREILGALGVEPR